MASSHPVCIVTDAGADLPSSYLVNSRVRVLPITITFGQRSFLHGVDLDTQTFYRMLHETGEIPTTASPPPWRIRALYQELIEGGYDVLSIHLSSTFSSTYYQCLMAAREVAPEHIALVDSRQMTIAQGLLVAQSAQYADAGASLDDVYRYALELIPRVRLAGLLQTLDYVEHGGRIPNLAVRVGGLLRVRPLFEVIRGEVSPLGFVRSESQAIRRLVRQVQSWGPLERVALIHADNPTLCTQLYEALNPPPTSTLIAEAGPTIVTHVGPGAIGIAALLAS